MKIHSIDSLIKDRNLKIKKLNLFLFWFEGKILIRALTILLILISILSLSQAGASDKAVSLKKTAKLDQKWTGDFDGMVERGMIRALVTFSETNYYLDKAHHRGITYEVLKEFEKTINKTLKRKHLKVHVVSIPVTRDQLIPALVEGRGDFAAAALISTPERKKVVDFANPLLKGVDEIVVTGPNTPKLSSLDDLSGQEIYVRKSSSYYERLVRLNESFEKAGKPQIILKPADEYLEDEDLLEMVNAELIPMIVINSYYAKFWSQIFKDIIVYPNITVNKGGEISWMIRKDSPKLKSTINDFVKGHKKGTLFGNIMFKRYLQSTKWVRNSLSGEDFERFRAAAEFFKKYAKEYRFDYLLVGALAYQESRIDQRKRSQAGAVGVMQLLPSTAADKSVNIPDIEEIENNIHAGIKYLRWLRDTYFENENMDRLNKGLFSLASYNAGPTKVRRLRKEASKMGLNPNIWFGNVEVVAAKRIGRETVQYVSNIYKYYISYRLIVEKKRIKETVKRQKNN